MTSVPPRCRTRAWRPRPTSCSEACPARCARPALRGSPPSAAPASAASTVAPKAPGSASTRSTTPPAFVDPFTTGDASSGAPEAPSAASPSRASSLIVAERLRPRSAVSCVDGGGAALDACASASFDSGASESLSPEAQRPSRSRDSSSEEERRLPSEDDAPLSRGGAKRLALAEVVVAVGALGPVEVRSEKGALPALPGGGVGTGESRWISGSVVATVECPAP